MQNLNQRKAQVIEKNVTEWGSVEALANALE